MDYLVAVFEKKRKTLFCAFELAVGLDFAPKESIHPDPDRAKTFPVAIRQDQKFAVDNLHIVKILNPHLGHYETHLIWCWL